MVLVFQVARVALAAPVAPTGLAVCEERVSRRVCLRRQAAPRRRKAGRGCVAHTVRRTVAVISTNVATV